MMRDQEHDHDSQAHKLAAIMFTDISGYTALMGENEILAMEIIRKNRSIQKPLIEKFGGIWLKEMGDGVLVRFDSALNAVLCATEIQRKIKDEVTFKVRIGIHLGDITIENNDIFGDGVNIASRIESISDPGGIYISESVVRAIRSNKEVNYKSIGTANLKNVSIPIQIYAITGEGLPEPSRKKIRELSLLQNVKRTRQRRITIFLTIILIAGIAWLIREFVIIPNAEKISSIAVLPLHNLTGGQEQEYFVAGMHDALITELSKIGSLRIISRQSTLRFLGSTISMTEIAKQLKVDAIVEGSVFKSGNQVRIQLQLIKTKPKEAHILAQAYDRELSDILNMHKEITQDIANRIEVELTAGEKSLLKETDKVNPEAYEAYLKGNFHWYKLTPESLEQAEKYYQLALEKDSEYALAYVGLASIGLGKAQMGYESVKESAKSTKMYMEKAYSLDSTMAEWYFLEAVFNTWGLWNWKKAETAFIKTFEYNPNYSIGRVYYAQYLSLMKRPIESLEQMALALQLDPLNTLNKEIYCMNLLFSGKYQEAQKILEDILEKAPDSRIALTTLRSVYHQKKQYDKAFEIWKRSFPNDPEALVALVTGYNQGGYSEALKSVAEMLIERSKTRFVTPWQIGTLYTRAGLKKEALFYLVKAYEANDPNIPSLNVDPIFDFLREDPEFMTLIEKLNFPV